jgi:hypothetical protein
MSKGFMAKNHNQTIKLLEWEQTIRKIDRVILERAREAQAIKSEGKKKKTLKSNTIILDKPLIMPKVMLKINKNLK